MKIPRTASFILGIILATQLVGQPLAHILEEAAEKVTRSLNRVASDYHRPGYRVFNRLVVRGIGGVLSQADRFVNISDAPLRVSIDLDAADHYPGYIVVDHSGTSIIYPIPYTDLVPMSLFIDSGGVSLYTLWDEGDLPANFQQDAGFSHHDGGGQVALEFRNTRYADALLYIDTCRACIDEPNVQLAEKIGSRFPIIYLDDALEGGAGESYINVDLEIPYQYEVDGSQVVVSGGIIRVHWQSPKDRAKPIFVRQVNEFVQPDQLHSRAEALSAEHQELMEETKSLLEYIEDRLDTSNSGDEDNEIIAVLGAKTLWSLFELREAQKQLLADSSDISRHRLQDALFLFETLALLRSAKSSDAVSWNGFMKQLRRDSLVRSNPEPWSRYTASYCSVYPEEKACR